MTEDENCSNLNAEGDEVSKMYKKDAVSVVTFKMVYDKEDFKLGTEVRGFKPDMAHQIFGESESIFGYRTLAINLYHLHNSSHCYVDIQCSGKIPESKLYQADDILKCLDPWMPNKYTTKKNEFFTLLSNETHDLMFGTVLHEFKGQQKTKIFSQNCYPQYKITLCDLNDDFKDFHKRFETLIIWFIDAANFIDLEDPRWMIFYVYEEIQNPNTKKMCRSPVGYCTVYKFFAYPCNVRARISQFFILPSHQRRGIGTAMYETVVQTLREMADVIDITVEEPTDIFQKIRDFDDCVSVLKCMQTKVEASNSHQRKIMTCMRKLKICKRQTQRIIDILACHMAGKDGLTAYNKVIDDIKARIANDIERDSRGCKRLCNLERAGMVPEPVDKKAMVDAGIKKYIDDIEPSIKYLESHIKIPVE